MDSAIDVLGLCFLLLLLELYCSVVSCHEISNVWTRQDGNGILCDSTPADLRNAFHSNCTQLNLTESVCNQAWDAFIRAFAHKDPDKVENR